MICAAVAMIIAAHAGVVTNREGMTDIALQNIEAIARSESDYSFCWDVGSVYCPITGQKARVVFY